MIHFGRKQDRNAFERFWKFEVNLPNLKLFICRMGGCLQKYVNLIQTDQMSDILRLLANTEHPDLNRLVQKHVTAVSFEAMSSSKVKPNTYLQGQTRVWIPCFPYHHEF